MRNAPLRVPTVSIVFAIPSSSGSQDSRECRRSRGLSERGFAAGRSASGRGGRRRDGRLPELVDRARVEGDAGADERPARPPGGRREEAAEGDLVEPVARKRLRLGAADEHRAGEELPAGCLVEAAKRRVAGEEADVGAAGRDPPPGGLDEPPPVAAAPELLVGDDGAEPARGPLPSLEHDRLREHVERRADPPAVEQQHREGAEQRAVAEAPYVERLLARPRRALKSQHLDPQRRRHLRLGERHDLHGADGSWRRGGARRVEGRAARTSRPGARGRAAGTRRLFPWRRAGIMAVVPTDVTGALEEGRRALRAGAWEPARGAFAAVLREEE